MAVLLLYVLLHFFLLSPQDCHILLQFLRPCSGLKKSTIVLHPSVLHSLFLCVLADVIVFGIGIEGFYSLKHEVIVCKN